MPKTLADLKVGEAVDEFGTGMIALANHIHNNAAAIEARRTAWLRERLRDIQDALEVSDERAIALLLNTCEAY